MEALIIASIKELFDLACITDTISENKSKLVFPVKRNETRRISEQEARFLLVRQLEKQEQTKYQYSIEAPTIREYSFSGKGKRSGNIDLCIYESKKRNCLIEFKALNHKQSSYSKDFEKLLYDENDLVNYFIHVLESSNDRTIPNMENKYRRAIKDARKEHTTLFPSNLKIFICDMGKKNIIGYEVDRNGTISNYKSSLCSKTYKTS